MKLSEYAKERAEKEDDDEPDADAVYAKIGKLFCEMMALKEKVKHGEKAKDDDE